MKNLSQILLLFVAAFWTVGRAVAQDSLSSRDASEIRYKAERMVKTELNELLNSLSSSGYETQEVAESIHSSFSESRNRIFRDSLVLVEPDINPGFQRSGQTSDEPVEKYLRDIDLLYKKSDSATVVFDNIRCSAVKKNQDMYVKVYFNSLFKGQSTISEQAYSMTNRLAEINAQKDGDHWRLYIVRLAFFNPEDTAGDVANNMPIKPDMASAMNVKNEFKPDAAQLYTGFINAARLQESKRQYKEAIESYRSAIRQRPEEATNLQPKIRQLTDRFAVLSDLQEKYTAGLIKEALKEYTEAIRKDPGNSDLYLGRGRCYEKLTGESKHLELALNDYSQAYELDHGNLPAIRYRAELYANMGQYFKALTDYTVYLTVDKSDLTLYARKSALHVQLKLYNEAIADLDEALAVDPKAASIYLAKGLFLMQREDLQRAIDNFSRCLQIDSGNAVALYNRGRCELFLGRLHEAGKDLADARKAGLDTASRRVLAEYAVNYYNLATAFFTKKMMDSAVRSIDIAIVLEPTSALYRLTKGEYSFAASDYMSAIVSYDLAVKYDPANIQAYYKRGVTWDLLEDHRVAIDNFDEALRLSPQHFLAMKGKGDALRALKDYGRAAVTYENALRIALGSRTPVAPTLSAELYDALGVCYFHLGQYDKTVYNERKAITEDRNLADAYFNRGNAYYRQGQLADAIEDMTKAISLLDRHPEWHYLLGRVYLDKKDFGNAEAQFAAYVQKDKELAIPDAIYRQGYCNLMLQNYTMALPYYSRSLALHLDTAHSFPVEMGVVYLNTGKYDSAYYYCHKAYQRDSTNGLASYGIGSSLALQGKADESIIWFERSFRMKTPSYAEIKRDRLLGDKIRNNQKFKDLLKKYF